MKLPNLVQGGEVRAFPTWAQYLAKLGRFMSQGDGMSVSSLPSIAVVCVPRIDYTSIFVGYGSLGALSNTEETGLFPPHHDLNFLLGKNVSYLKIRGSEQAIVLGRLECINPAAGEVTLLTKINPTSHERYIISRKDSNWIRGTDVSFDIARGATNNQRQRAGEGYSEYQQIAKVAGHSLASAATRISGPYLTVIGEKSRFIEELASLDFNFNEASISAGLLLNSETEGGDYFRHSGRYIQLLASGRALSEAHASIVVIEAGRRLGDQLTQISKDKRAIILVAANKRSHNDVVELLAPMINFRGLHDSAPDLGETPHYLKTIFIR